MKNNRDFVDAYQGIVRTSHQGGYSKGQKNDFPDAEVIAEAVQRPTMKFVATKTADQLDLQALHRVREHAALKNPGILPNAINVINPIDVTIELKVAASGSC